ncbi:MAG: hypothetical protein K2N78_01240 [Oscillospiraceae bacterium]|nr:hypothetical protein [Oscillospiraceae bacterium]
MRGSNISESKLRIYTYYKQGHDAKECAVFLRNEYGEGGYVHGGYNENHGSKGIQFTRSDEESGYKGYDTVQLNWNQVQKRIRDLIDSGRYLNEQERAYLPAYETQTLARKIYHFYSSDPNRTNPPSADMDAAVKEIRSVLESDDPEKKSELFHEIFNIMAAVPPDSPVYQRMMPVLRDMEAFQRGEYSLYAPLPEDVLQVERQAKQAAKEAKRKTPAIQPTASEDPPASDDRLAAAARALAKKMPSAAQEDQDGQFNLFSSVAPVPLEPEPPAPIPGVQPTPPPQAQREITDADLDHFLIEDLGDPARKQRLYALFTESWSDAMIVRKLEQEYSRSRRGNLEGGFCTLADGTRGYAYFTKELRISPRPEGKMRHVSFEEMAAHIRQLIQEDRYLSPEEMEQYQKDHAIPEPEKEPEAAPSSWWDSYNEIKEANPDSIVLFQAGDFFEMYGEDAKTAAALLNLNLTTRPILGTMRVEMCGIPTYTLDQTVERLRASHDVTVASIDETPGKWQAHTMRSFVDMPPGTEDIKTTVTVPNYEVTVMEAEATLFAKLLENNKIGVTQFVHKNGDVTFSLAASDKDRAEKLIAKWRAAINQAVKESYHPPKPRRTRAELNYNKFAKLFPEIVSGEYRYLSMEAGESMMPLHLEWIDTDVIAISHTYVQEGDLMRDPEMTFRVDREKGTLEPLTFQQDGSIPLYQQVYPEPGRWIPKLRSDLNTFAQQWLKNISEQRYIKREAVIERDGEDVRLTFDQDGKAVEPVAAPTAENALGDNPTVREIHEHYAPMVKDLVLADETYRNACVNSDRDLARLEGNEAIKRAVLTINDPVLLKQYYDNAAFHNRLHQEIINETYPMLSQPQREQAAQSEAVEWTASPVTLYRDVLEMVDREISRGGWLYEQLRDRSNDYDTAKDALETELDAYVNHVASGYPDIMAAYHTLPKFREWLIEDLMERNYQDASLDQRDAPDRHANDADAPEWARGAPPTPKPQYVTWSAKGPIKRQKPAPAVPTVEHSESEQAGDGGELPPEPELVPEPDDAGALLTDRDYRDTYRNIVPAEDHLIPNAEKYLDLKVQYPDKLVGIQLGNYVLFYGKDAEEAGPALNRNVLVRDFPELGFIPVSGSDEAWQAVLKKLLEHGKSVVLARSDPERGPDVPYEIIKERDAADYIPLGMELTIDGRHMKIDSVDFQAGTVSLQDLDMKGWFPIFRSEPIPFVREFVEEVQQSEEYIATEMAEQLRKDEFTEKADAESPPVREAVDEIPVGMELTIDGHRMKIDSVDKAGNDVMLLDLDARGGPPMFIVRPAPFIRRRVAEAQTAVPPETERVEIDGGQIVPPPPPAPRQPSQKRHNFQITDDNLGVGGEKTKYQYNVTAIRTLKQIEAEGRLAMPEEQEILSRYVGWGGIAKAFDPQDPKWAKEYAELKELLTPQEYESAQATVLNAHYARFVP